MSISSLDVSDNKWFVQEWTVRTLCVIYSSPDTRLNRIEFIQDFGKLVQFGQRLFVNNNTLRVYWSNSCQFGLASNESQSLTPISFDLFTVQLILYKITGFFPRTFYKITYFLIYFTFNYLRIKFRLFFTPWVINRHSGLKILRVTHLDKLKYFKKTHTHNRNFVNI